MKGFIRRFFICIIIYLLLLFMLPALIIFFFSRGFPPPTAPSANSIKVNSFVVAENTLRDFPLEEYLVGVVGAEMPATFPLEALKAQAVAARTFIISRMNESQKEAHGGTGASVCTDPAHCKAWKSDEELRRSWGEGSEEYYKKIKAAVEDTRGEIVLFRGQPISAVYYSMSSGNTENSEDVWGGVVPYLKSVSSSFDENAPGFNSSASFTTDEFKGVILQENPDAVLEGDPAGWITEIKNSEGGGVLSLKIGGQDFKGTRLRTLFSLRSHNFTVSISEGIVTFDVKGYGHGVGMSQWGSRFLAEEGKTYEEILKYYYTGVEMGNI